jgi:hypothetical protein
MAVVGRFAQRRIEQICDEHDFWCVDDWEAIAAEIGAELGISRGVGARCDPATEAGRPQA